MNASAACIELSSNIYIVILNTPTQFVQRCTRSVVKVITCNTQDVAIFYLICRRGKWHHHSSLTILDIRGLFLACARSDDAQSVRPAGQRVSRLSCDSQPHNVRTSSPMLSLDATRCLRHRISRGVSITSRARALGEVGGRLDAVRAPCALKCCQPAETVGRFIRRQHGHTYACAIWRPRQRGDECDGECASHRIASYPRDEPIGVGPRA